MAEAEDLRIEQAEDRAWEALRDTVDEARVNLDETYEEFLARTEPAEKIREKYVSKFDKDRPHFIVVDE